MEQDRSGYGLLAVAVFSAIGLCLPALQGQPLALDEHVSYFTAGAPTVSELWTRTLEDTVTPPFSHLIERCVLAIGGHSETVFRLSSLTGYIAAVAVSFFLGRRCGGAFAGGLTAVIVAWCPEVLDDVRFARSYGLTLLLAASSLWALVRWLDQPLSRTALCIWSLFTLLLFWTHYLAAPLIAIEGAVVAVKAWQLSRKRQATVTFEPLVAIAAQGVLILPLWTPLIRLTTSNSIINHGRSTASLSQAFGTDWLAPALATLAIAWIGRRFGTNSAADSDANRRGGRWMWAAWLIPLAMLGLAAWLGNPLFANARYRVVFVPAAAATIAVTLSRSLPRLAASVLTMALLVTAWTLSPATPLICGRLANPIDTHWKNLGLELAKELPRQDLLVFTQTGLLEGALLPLKAGDERFFKYVACRLGAFYTNVEKALPIPLLWSPTGPVRNDYDRRLARPEIREVWLVGSTETDLNTASVETCAALILAAGFSIQSDDSREGLRVTRFHR